MTETATRFWSKVDKNGPVPSHNTAIGRCWIWTASLGGNGKGYGQFRVNGDTVRSHRFAYELAYGPIPRGYQIDHACHNRACVNPSHLRLATNQQNSQNRKSANRLGLKGVVYNKKDKKYEVRLCPGGTRIYRGQFNSPDEAHAEYIKASNEIYGEFAFAG